MKALRIFISSPGDVAEERDKARQVIASLQQSYGDQVTLIPVLWEEMPIPATASFQEGIDVVLAERHRIDIAVFILWSRLGSPLGGTIVKRDGSPYRSGTEREFDLMLAAYEQSGRKIPVLLAYTRDDSEGFNERLDARTQAEEALEEMIRQRKLVKQFIQERFHDEQGRNLRAYHSYREPVSFAQRLHVHLRAAVDELLGLDAGAALWTEAPYRSLEVFDIRHAPIFCGRDEETCEVLERLRDQQAAKCGFVCIVGASGSGKSSLARAGAAATLMQRSFDDGTKEWRAAVFVPSLAQGELFLGLARCVAEALPELRQGVGGLEKIARCFEGHNLEAAAILLETAFNNAQTELGGPLRLLLVLDQMEELWTDRSITPDQREEFLLIIEFLARCGSVSVVATLRSDFYPQAQLSPAFLRLKAGHGHFDLVPPGTAALQQIIVQPAHRAGLTFERDPRTGRTLDQRILEDAARDPSALPLLQYALAELYERRETQSGQPANQALPPGITLTFAAYEAMGGVEGALTRRAAQTLARLPTDAQAALEELLPLLISVDIAGEQSAIRRRSPKAALTNTPVRRALTEALIQARLLTTDEHDSTAIATLAHEALLRRWDRVAAWINTNRDLLRMRSRVEQSCAMWEESGRADSRLLPSGLPLEEGRSLLAAGNLLDEETRNYVEASRTHHASLRQRARRRRYAVMAGLGVLALAAITGGWVAWQQRSSALTAKRLAVEAKRLTVTALNRLVDEVIPLTVGTESEAMKTTAELVQGKSLAPFAVADESGSAVKQREGLIGIVEIALAQFPETERDKDVDRLEAIALVLRAAHDLERADLLNPDKLRALFAAHPNLQAAQDAFEQEMTKGPAKSWERLNQLMRETQAAALAASPELASATEKSRLAIPLFEKLLPLFPEDADMRFRYGITLKIWLKQLANDEAEFLKYHELAVRMFENVAAMDKKHEPDALAAIAATHEDLATLYFNLGEPDKAAPYYKLADSTIGKLETTQLDSPKWLRKVAEFHQTRAQKETLLIRERIVAEQLASELKAQRAASARKAGGLQPDQAPQAASAGPKEDYKEVLEHLLHAVGLHRKIVSLDANSSKLPLARALQQLAQLRGTFQHRHDDAINHSREAIELVESSLRAAPASIDALDLMVALMHELSFLSYSLNDSVTAEWAAEQAVEHQRRLVALSPFNLQFLSELNEKVGALQRRYWDSKDESKRDMAKGPLKWESLELAEKGLWLTRNSPPNELLQPEQSPDTWITHVFSAILHSPLLTHAETAHPELAPLKKSLETAWTAANKDTSTVRDGRPWPSSLPAARISHDLAGKVIAMMADGGLPETEDVQMVARALLIASRYLLTRAGQTPSLDEADRKRVESVDALLQKLPQPPYLRPLLDQLEDQRRSASTPAPPGKAR